MQHHLRYALRRLLREWPFSLMAIFTLALGIGAASGLFSVMRHLLWSELPYAEPGRLAFVWSVNPQATAMTGIHELPSTPLDFSTYLEEGKSFEAIALIESQRSVLDAGSGETERIHGARVTGQFFPLLGVRPAHGRFFGPEDDAPGKADIVVISHRLWKRRFGSSPDVVGKQLRLDNQPFTVIGVAGPAMVFPSGNDLPAPYRFGTKTDLWVPRGESAESMRSPDNRSFPVIARLRPGVDVMHATAELQSLSANIQKHYPADSSGWSSRAVLLREQVAREARSILWILAAAIGCLLLIAAANFSQLLLARTMRRTQELGVRAALGASRRSLAAQLLIENTVLALCGGLLGAAGASGALVLVVRQASATIPHLEDVTLDLPLLGFSIAAALFVGVAFGLMPAFVGSSNRLAETLKQSGRAVAGGGGRSRAALIVGQLALATVLLTVNLLLVRSLWNVASLDTGFDSQQVATVQVTLDNRYPDGAAMQSYRNRVIEELRNNQSVIGVGMISALPLSGEENLNSVWPEGRPPQRGEALFADDRRVQGAYFEAMGIEMLDGTDFRPDLSRESERVIIVNRTLAERFFPGESGVGRRVTLSSGRIHRIAGVVEDVRQGTLEAPPRLQIYRAAKQDDMSEFSVVARLRSSSVSDLQSFRESIRRIDPGQYLSAVSTMEATVSNAVARRTFWTILLGVFAALAVFITLAGLHASVSYHATTRMPEFGLRAALGATSGSLARLVMRQGVRYAAAGLAIGLFAAILARPVITSQIYGIGALDPLSLGVAAAGVLLIAVLASLTPALRAARSDPSVVLRND